MQEKQKEWLEQWSMLEDNELFLFRDWIRPYDLETFRGKEVLECGCGGGQHTRFMAPYAARVTAVDLNTSDLARERNKEFANVEFVEGDIATMNLGKKFDVVISIGVVHHTDDPDKTMANLAAHLKPGGLLIVWVYSKEGNFLVENVVEPVRKIFLRNLSRATLLLISRLVTAAMYPPIYSLYLLPLRFLPYYEYFQNFRKLSFYRNVLNVFDKLNAPQVDMISRPRAEKWIKGMDSPKIYRYRGVSYTVSAVARRAEANDPPGGATKARPAEKTK